MGSDVARSSINVAAPHLLEHARYHSTQRVAYVIIARNSLMYLSHFHSDPTDIWKYRKEQRAMAAFIRRKSASLEEEEPLTEPEGSYRSIRLPERKDSDRNSKASKGRRDEDDTASASASGKASSRRGEDPIAPVSLYESTEEIIRAVPISRAVERSSSKMEMQEPLSASEDKADQ
jgi:hypothetical protein